MNIFIHADKPLLNKLIHTPVDGVVLGVRPFAHRMRETYAPEDLKEAIKIANDHNKQVFINMNAIVHEGDLNALDYVFETLKPLSVDGILFADLAMVDYAEKHGLKYLLIYDAETYLTNHEDVSFWDQEKIKAAVGARQLTIDDIVSIANKSTMPFGIQGHGHVNMFHSARRLVETYFKHTKADTPEMHNWERLDMVEAKREDEPYPVYQDDFGTHVFRSKPMHSFNVLNRLKGAIAYFLVDTLFYDDTRVITIAHDLVNARDEGVKPELLDRYTDHDEGFLHKKTVYKQGTVK